MTAAESRKAQWESLKDKPLTKKIKYIFTYYWAAILGVVCVIAFAVSWISSALSQKDTALAGYLLNASTRTTYEGSLVDEFMALQQIDADTYIFKLTADATYSSTDVTETSIYVLESIVTQIAARELDFLVTDLATYPILSAYFADLRMVLPSAQLEKLEPYFVYVERAALEDLTSGELDALVLPEYFLSAEGLEDPLPIGIRLPDTCRLFDAYAFPKGDVVFGITNCVINTENTIAFLEYILD